MWSRSSFLDELVPYLGGEGKVCETVAVKMSELYLPQPELDASKAMLVRRHSVQFEYCLLDRVARSLHARSNASKDPLISGATPCLGAPGLPLAEKVPSKLR